MGVDNISITAAAAPLTPIHTIQGAAHISPLNTQIVSTSGIVSAKTTNGFWMQDPAPDADDATSEGIFVFTSSAPTANVGDDVDVTATVSEFRPGGAAYLTTTELTSPTIATNSSGNPLPAPIVIGSGGRTQPTTVIEDDAAGDVETSGVFDPATDGIDFYESLEGMRIQVNNPVATGPRNSSGEISVLPDDGASASVRTARGGIVVRASDFNPERIILDDLLASTPAVNTGDHFSASAVGVLGYSSGNFKLLDSLAGTIVNNLRSPDILSLEEVQDNNGTTNDTVVDASTTFNTLISAITTAGGPTYAYRQIDPVDDQDGGEPGGNIRVANVSNPQIVVLGDFNDFEFSNPLNTLKGGVLTDQIETLPQSERYTYVFEGNSEVLDHILVNSQVTLRLPTDDVVHVNSEFAVQNSEHEPQLLRYDPTPTPTAAGVTSLSAVRRGGSAVLRWRTGSEIGIAGFNVYREQVGRRVRLNRGLIAASGTPLGRRYAWNAGRVGPSRYWLQMVRLDGSRRARQRDEPTIVSRISGQPGACAKTAAGFVVKSSPR